MTTRSVLNKCVFMTGDAGFIANRIISRLVDSNQILVYDNFRRDTLSNSEFPNHASLKIIKCDVLDYEKVLESMNGAN